MRKHENYGPWTLSVQGSENHYCSPRVWLDNLSEYESVEVALFNQGNWARPEDAGLAPDLCNLWEQGDIAVAGYVSQTDLARIRAHLASLAKQPG